MNLAISSALDLAIVVIFVICILLGVRKGLIRSVIDLVGKIIALILALVFSAGLGQYLDTNYINGTMRDWVVGQLTASSDSNETSVSDVDLDDLFANTPEFFVTTCEFLGVDVNQLRSEYNSWKSEGTEQARSAVITAMVNPLSALVSRVLAFALIFIVASLALFLISLLVGLAVHLPVIRQFDKAGGALFGVLNALLIVFVLASVFSAGSKYMFRDKTEEERDQITQGTVLYRIFDAANPLQNILDE